MQLLENKNDKRANNEDKQLFISFKLLKKRNLPGGFYEAIRRPKAVTAKSGNIHTLNPALPYES